VIRALAACLGLLVLAGCTGDGPAEPAAPSGTTSRPAEPAPDQPVAEPPEPPRVGACYRITLAQAARPTNDARAVDCGRRHSARTIHVGRLDTVVDGHAVAVDSDRVQRQLAGTCPAELAAFLGGDPETRALSRFQAIWFSPTLEEYDAGADWFRCDVVALAGPDQLLTLPSQDRFRGILDRPGKLATYGLCGTAQPGADGFERVACARPHSWAAISTIPIQGGDRYPGVETVREAGEERCSDQVRGRNDFALEYSYGWEWPTADQWAAGQRYGICWAPDNPA
jgi:hypothetical protein